MRLSVMVAAILVLTPISLAHAASNKDVQQMLDEARQMRAEEFAPEHYALAQTLATHTDDGQTIDEA